MELCLVNRGVFICVSDTWFWMSAGLLYVLLFSIRFYLMSVKLRLFSFLMKFSWLFSSLNWCLSLKIVCRTRICVRVIVHSEVCHKFSGWLTVLCLIVCWAEILFLRAVCSTRTVLIFTLIPLVRQLVMFYLVVAWLILSDFSLTIGIEYISLDRLCIDELTCSSCCKKILLVYIRAMSC
jgi:hypothetical protein